MDTIQDTETVMRTCDVCGSNAFHPEHIDESFHVDGELVLVEGVPAMVCDRCGDASFDAATTEALRQMLHGDRHPTRHVSVDVFAFAAA